MKWRDEAIMLLACAVFVLPHSQQDEPSAFDKCRIVTSSDLTDNKAPHFTAYRIPTPEVIEGPKLDLKSNPTARMYRTLLRQEVARGPNFAGHYRVAIWGCGSSCAMFAVINLNTGRVITPEGFSATSYVYFDVDQNFFPGSQSWHGQFGFRKDSRLLVVLGDLDEDESREGAFYLVLDAERLRPIHSTLVEKNLGRSISARSDSFEDLSERRCGS
jgi:hypothetical protein